MPILSGQEGGWRGRKRGKGPMQTTVLKEIGYKSNMEMPTTVGPEGPSRKEESLHNNTRPCRTSILARRANQALLEPAAPDLW